MYMKFQKKPVVIEAIQALPENIDEILSWSTNERPIKIATEHYPKMEIFITTLEGMMRADEGDWIIKGVNGEVYPCKPDIFEATYEAGRYPLF